MLKVFVPKREFWNEITEEFIRLPEATLTLEHSLISISKWESKWHKPFLSGKPMTEEENADYIRCMTIRGPDDPIFYHFLPKNVTETIRSYVNDTMTATVFKDKTPPMNNGRFITSELIYYWMTALNIPTEYEKWHLNRLMTLIRVCNEENQPKKKMSTTAALQQQSSLNAARRAKHRKRG